MLPFYEVKDSNIFINSFENFSFPAHFHQGLEILILEKGNIKITVNGQTSIAEKGEIAVIYPHYVHSYELIDNGKNKGYVLLLKDALLYEYNQWLANCRPNPFVYSLDSLHPDILHAAQTITQKQETSFTKEVYAKVLLCRLLPVLHLDAAPCVCDDMLYRVLNYISAHFTEPMTLQSMADAVYMDKYRLSRLFSSRLHTSFPDYVNRLRVEYAAAKLLSTTDSVTNVAMEAGFDNIRTFHRAFGKVFQMSPKEYQKINLQQQLTK